MKKTLEFLIRPLFTAIAIMLSVLCVHAQHLDKVTVEKMVNSRDFVFKAQTVVPTGAVSRVLTSEYDLKVMGDSVNSYLPYFGRAYQAPFPGESGIQFSTTHFKYKASERKKGGWHITIEPEDTRNVREMDLTVYDNGNAYLQVLSNYRQPISFNGYIEAVKEK